MRRLLTILLFLGIITPLHATHLIGGAVAYECFGNNQYKVTLTVYRDAVHGQAGFDNPAPIAVYTASGNLVRVLTASPVIDTQSYYMFSPFLVPAGTPWKVDIGTYDVTTTLQPNPGGYYLVYQRCCYTHDITNLTSSGSQGFSLFSHLTEDAMQTCNTGPRLDADQPNFICQGDSFSFLPHFSDPDGDTLRYRLGPIFQGGAAANPAPNPPTAPPYDTSMYDSSYSPQLPFGAAAFFSIDSLTGLISGKVDSLGLYQVGILIDEYRQGQKLGTHYYNFPFVVDSCALAGNFLKPLGTDTLLQKPYTIRYAVDSFYQLAQVHWDFGDTTTTADEFSGFSASYTYPQGGIYHVRVLYEFEGLTDTAYGTVICQDPVGLEQPEANQILLYPNPGNDQLVILTEWTELEEIAVSALTGRTVIRTSKRTIPTDDLPGGTYLVTGRNQQGKLLFTLPWVKAR